MRSVGYLASIVTVLCAVLSFGCAGVWQRKVISQASFDHQCPEQQVAILRDNGDGVARAVELNVCGQSRMYRDVGGTQMYLFRDVTDQQSWGAR
jgi:hypothetical protein